MLKNMISSFKEAVTVPLKFHWSVLILPLLILYHYGLFGIPLFLMLFGSLLFHEYAHVWMAQKQGLYVPYVITHGFGAAAMIGGADIFNYKQNFKIAFTGPIASILLFIVGFFLHIIFQSVWTSYFLFINFALGSFNLLPIFPSDGGRILYSAIGLKLGAFKAIRIVVWTSRILCGVGIAYGLIVGSWWLVMVLGLIIMMGEREKKVIEEKLT